MENINYTQLARYYFAITEPNRYDFTRKDGKGYESARKGLMLKLSKGNFDESALKTALIDYETEQKKLIAEFRLKYNLND